MLDWKKWFSSFKFFTVKLWRSERQNFKMTLLRVISVFFFLAFVFFLTCKWQFALSIRFCLFYSWTFEQKIIIIFWYSKVNISNKTSNLQKNFALISVFSWSKLVTSVKINQIVEADHQISQSLTRLEIKSLHA